jgi:hypothetical protein
MDEHSGAVDVTDLQIKSLLKAQTAIINSLKVGFILWGSDSIQKVACFIEAG